MITLVHHMNFDTPSHLIEIYINLHAFTLIYIGSYGLRF